MRTRTLLAFAVAVLGLVGACGDSSVTPPAQTPTRYEPPVDTHACAASQPADCEDQCAQGNPESCTTLGELLLKAHRSPEDRTRAFSLFEQACRWDQGRACFLAAEQIAMGGIPSGTTDRPACLPANDSTDRLRPLLARGCELKDVDACFAFTSKMRVDTCVIGYEGSRWGATKLAGICAEGDVSACKGCVEAVLRPIAHPMDLAGFSYARKCFQYACSGDDDVACAAYQIYGPEGWYDNYIELKRIAERLDRQCVAKNAQACAWGSYLAKRAAMLEADARTKAAVSGKKKPAFVIPPPPSPNAKIRQ